MWLSMRWKKGTEAVLAFMVLCAFLSPSANVWVGLFSWGGCLETVVVVWYFCEGKKTKRAISGNAPALVYLVIDKVKHI
jgi:hypothetical protein